MRLGAGGATPAGSTCDLSLAYNWMRFPCDQDLAGDWRNLAKSVSYYHMSMLFSAWWEVVRLGRFRTPCVGGLDFPCNAGNSPHRPGLAAPDSRDHKLLTAVRGLSRQLARFAADVNDQLTAVNAKLHSIDERMTALEEVVNSRACVEEKRKRQAHNPKIAVCMCACMRRVR